MEPDQKSCGSGLRGCDEEHEMGGGVSIQVSRGVTEPPSTSGSSIFYIQLSNSSSQLHFLSLCSITRLCS